MFHEKKPALIVIVLSFSIGYNKVCFSLVISDLFMKLKTAPSLSSTAKIQGSKLGTYTQVGEFVSLIDCQFGDYSYVEAFSDLMNCTVGKFVSIAKLVRINASNHPMWRTSQHHFQYRSSYYDWGEDEEAFFRWRKDHHCEIGHDVWIGHGAIVLPGRHVGVGSAVGAGSVVTKNVPPYSIVAGNPAKLIRPRFSAIWIGEAMEELAWWDWPHDKLGAALPDFRSMQPEAFIEKWSSDAW